MQQLLLSELRPRLQYTYVCRGTGHNYIKKKSQSNPAGFFSYSARDINVNKKFPRKTLPIQLGTRNFTL